MKTSFETWWAGAGYKEYQDMCRAFGITPTNDTEKMVKFTAWEAYSVGMTTAMKIMAEAA